ncbi:MAG: hypothetical protein AAFP82_22900, partial [Bacteroidota bacterium]
IFFNYDLIKNKHSLGIVRWSKEKDIRTLRESSNAQHQLLGETLELYLKQDASRSNFEKMQDIFFVTLNNQIVGGTSPSTLFFTNGNDLSFAQLMQGNDTFFDDQYTPLYSRDVSYQKYLYALFKIHKNLTEEMELFWNYLTANLVALRTKNNELFQEIESFNKKLDYTAEQFEKDFQKWDNKQIVEVFPNIAHLKKSTAIPMDSVGDFLIDSRKYQDKKPVVLQNEFTPRLTLFGMNWQSDYKVPYKDDDELNKRFIPIQGIQYPYLTVSDFLEPYLINVPYALDDSKFFNGNPKGFFEGDRTTEEPPDDMYLLPIKKDYFQFFDVADLRGNTIDGKPIFKMVKIGMDAVRVELLIPIIAKGQYIKFERVYKNDVKPNEYDNVGTIKKCKFSLGFFPFNVDNTKIEQRVGLVDADVLAGSKESQYKLEFVKVSAEGWDFVSPDTATIRSDEAKGHNHNATSKYFLLKENYNFIEVSNSSEVRGLVIPMQNKVNEGSKKFTFAIDFGTTNSHMEYSIDGGNPI